MPGEMLAGPRRILHYKETLSGEVGHFDLLFTGLYAAIVGDIFHTLAKSDIPSFQFFLGSTLLIVVLDHWLMHFRNPRRDDGLKPAMSAPEPGSENTERHRSSREGRTRW